MGYNLEQVPSSFFLAAENKEAVLSALTRAAYDACLEQVNAPGSDGRCYEGYWPQASLQGVLNARTLEESISMFRWKCSRDEERNIVAIFFEGQRWGSERILFNILMPHAAEGSFVAMRGEDGTYIRWTAHEGQVVEEISVDGATTWLPWPRNVHPIDFYPETAQEA